MGHHVIKMPDIGEGIAEVELIAWKVTVGGPVAEDEVVAEVMTDKAMVEIPSPVSGVVVSLGGKPGEMMAVGSELIRLEVEGVGNTNESVVEEKPAPVTAPIAASTKPAPTCAASKSAETAEAAVVTPPVKPISDNTTRGPITNGVLSANEAPLASPAVRRRAWELGIELRYVPATGAGGRIVHADLDAYIAAGGKAQAPNNSNASAYTRRTGE